MIGSRSPRVAPAGEPVKQIAERIGRCYQTVYRELARNRKGDGRYQPWFAHNQAYLRRRRVKLRRFAIDAGLRGVVAGKLAKHWSPAQISRWLWRSYPRRVAGMCTRKRSMRRSIEARLSRSTGRICGPAAPINTAAVGAGPATGVFITSASSSRPVGAGRS